MSHAEKMFHRSTDPLDRAYWRGAIDGEAAKQERIIALLQREASEWISKGKEDLQLIALIEDLRLIALIKGENQ